jgi:hypothetical protein
MKLASIGFATLASVLLLAFGAAVAQASFGVTEANFEAGTCTTSSCTYSSPSADFYTQAAGHPEWGITSFELNHSGAQPEGQLKRIRVDVPPGLAADPQAPTPACSRAQFDSDPGGCPSSSKVGKVEMVAYLEALGIDSPTLTGTVYNLDEEANLPLLFGIDVEPAGPVVTSVHLFLEGHVSDTREASLDARGGQSADYHEYFEINNVPTETEVLGLIKSKLKVLSSKLLFEGHAGGNFLTLPSVCSTSTTSFLEVESYEGQVSSTETHTPVGVSGCSTVPFAPTAAMRAQTSQYDEPDGAVTEVKVPQNEGAAETNTADVADAHVLLPEGLTLNPSAAHGLEACTPAEVHFEEDVSAACPSGSRIGSVTIETDLPPGTLSGGVYLGAPSGTPITGPPFTVYLVAESVYNVLVKLEGTVYANESTGQLEAVFDNSKRPFNVPQLPFSDIIVALNDGPRAPLANPLSCSGAATQSSFAAYSGEGITKLFAPSSPFATSGCPTGIPFAIGQSTASSSTTAGAFTSFTFNLERGNGQQYLGSDQTVLPAGLVGLIPKVTLCQEPQASQGNCSSASEIGTAQASAGSGSEPYAVSGPVYLTGPTAGAPYGLSIPIEAAAGPFDLGRITTRVSIGVDPHSGRVVATAALPYIQRGVPLRLRTLTVSVTKPNFMFNPTDCNALATESTVISTGSALDKPSSAFQVKGCSSLPFKPVFAASSPTTPSRANGASLRVSFTQPEHQADIRSVVAQLPKQLPSRLSTLHKACLEATFARDPYSCPKESRVGAATVTTPVLPEKLTGPAYLVSRGGAAFPNLELVLEGDHGVKVILEGNTNIKSGITTSTFASVPDVPVSSFELNLPVGPYSALGSYGSLCAAPLYMPTTITAQSGTQLKQNVRLSIGSCKIKLLSHRIKGHTLIVKVQTFTAGRVSVTSAGLHPTYKHVGGPTVVTIKVPLSRRGKRRLAAGEPLRVRFRVGFNPKHGDEYHSAVFATTTFRG